MKALHSLLGLDKSNPLFEILIDPQIPDELLVHFGMHLLEKVHRGKIEEKLLAARLYNSKFSTKHITAAFGFDRKTLRRWGQALKGGDVERIVRAFAGQGAEKRMIPMLECYVRATYREVVAEKGCHSNEFIRKELKAKFGQTFCHELLRRILLDEEQKMTVAAADIGHQHGHTVAPELSTVDVTIPATAPVTADEALAILAAAVGSGLSDRCQLVADARENSCDNPAALSLIKPGICNNSPVGDQDRLPGFPVMVGRAGTTHLCHHAGLTLCRIFIDGVTRGLGDDADIVRQWIGMILCGCMNIENGRSLNYPALELLLGAQVWSSDRQREKLHAIAGETVARAILERNIRLVGAELADTFLYDPHGIEYTGQLKTLKGWLGSSHKVAKAYYQDFIHTADGAPVFVSLDDNYSDMRARFITNIAKFRLILGGDQARRLTVVVDRAIYDVDYLVDLKCNHSLEIITWEKNYRRGQWETVDTKDTRVIRMTRAQNDSADTVTHTARYVRRNWAREPSFLQFIVMLAKPGQEPVELSVICTDTGRPDEACLVPILCRWLQENDFMFLDRLGINEITSYTSVSYEEIAAGLQDREVANLARKSQCAKRLDLKKELGLLLVSLEEFKKDSGCRQAECQEAMDKLDADASKLPPNHEAIRERRRKLKASTTALHKRQDTFVAKNEIRCKDLWLKIAALNTEITGQEESVSRIERLIEDKYRKLNFMPKTVMDCVKIVARNIIYNRLMAFRPIYDNRRNDHVLLRELIEATGHIHENGTSVVVSLYPSRHYPKDVKGKIMDFLLAVSCEANRFYRPGKAIIFTLYEP